MEKKSSTYVVVLSGILLGVVFTGVLSFLLIFFVSYITYTGTHGSGGVIGFDRSSGSVIGGIVSMIVGGFGGAVLGGIVGGGRLGKAKSSIIGGIINVSVPIILVVVLDNGGRNIRTNLFPYFCGQLIAGVIGGFLVSAILRSADKEQEEMYE